MRELLPLKNVHVLIVDDNQDTSVLFTLVFETYGAQATTAGSVKEGIEQAKQINPDIIIADMLLPDGSGKELLDFLRNSPDQKLRNIPVVSVTGVTHLEEQSTGEHMKTAGFQAFLAKPINPEKLVELVRALLSDK